MKYLNIVEAAARAQLELLEQMRENHRQMARDRRSAADEDDRRVAEFTREIDALREALALALSTKEGAESGVT